ncbi:MULTISPECIES: ScyD/ScyE family protein [unclassified Arthrobacter]|uniref:ScyD/ScyE family protein n=1 Tax=unclassified Arthrobacter TaxID=235627 RepID=UPI002E0BEC66|nr:MULTISPECIES: ScyD/ScyE family protein [unclassified Arthrobacter]MEC5190538.1 sugar lactone lactonase YvrE [Arthrobacter sp. MP_M4]MEC5201889.1 sugar lactone lactonase YvrE [Arthrobacter sp. MP_M7]
MRKHLSLLATAALAAVFVSAGAPAGAVSAVASTTASTASGGAADNTPVVLTGRLVGPLSLSAGHHGSVTVSESFAGRLTQVDSGGNQKVLYETADWDVSGNAQHEGTRYVLESQGAGPDPAVLAGHVRVIDEDGLQRTVGDFAALEVGANPDGTTRYGFRDLPEGCAAQLPVNMPASYDGEVDSHPYAIAVTDGTFYVADAGANSVVSVDAGSGKTRTVAVLPPRPYTITPEAAASNGLPDCVVGTTYDFEAVPTDVAVGPDGYLYVTSLPGGPEDPALGPRGAIFKVNPDEDEVELVAENIMSPTGLALADNGEIYVASLFGEGVLRIDPDSGDQTVVLAASFTADIDLCGSTLYATVNALPGAGGPPDGQVVHLDLDVGRHDGATTS